MSDRKVLEVRLVCLSEGDGIPERRVVLAAGQDVIVGRASSNRGVAASADNTKINNPVISKEHAAFTTNPAGTTVLIKDLRSMHGTRVNERELSQGEECEIFSGDALQFGSPVIRGNVTYKPAKFTFYADAVNHSNAFSSVIPASIAVSQSQVFSDTKKGYGDDSSLYSDDYDLDFGDEVEEEEEEDYTSNNEQADVTMVPDTYSSEQDSDASPDDSVDSSSEDSADESERSDDMSVEEHCLITSPVTFAIAPTETSSTAAVPDQYSFCSSYLEESGERSPSVHPSGPSMGIDMDVSTGEWPEYSAADQSVYLTSTSNAWTSDAADSFNLNMETDEASDVKKHKSLQSGSNKSRPFSNSINDLCEPAPEADSVALGPESTVLETGAAKEMTTGDAPDDEPISLIEIDEKMMEDPQGFINEAAAAVKLEEGNEIETIRAKRTADEAQLDTLDAVDHVDTVQTATPAQMSKRRIASFTRRARDFGLAFALGGAAVFTWLAATPEVA
ncbi:hypothetical protein GTA08_BOTSDO06749 [Botryosphaeria dothidea]|uniref:FHA domain-containing protein n=1 Tax=Botryosphaeria dothidea TaxID=55169 RepID=A0A8H4N1V9_9PEZI|nr:hypothetical protein GTA08_BOTSDO06749 [Botryosphaeria dothidea]